MPFPRPTSLSSVLSVGVALLLAVPLACSEGPDFGDNGLPGATGGAGPGLADGGSDGPLTGAGGTASSSGGSGQGPTEVICTPGCEDVPRSSESCADAQAWGFCSQDWFGDSCKKTCGKCDGEEEVCVEVPVEGTGGTSGGTGGSSGGGTSSVTPVPANSPQGWASRYWDCCKQHCSWPENAPGNTAVSCDGQDNVISDDSAQSSCGGGNAHTCWSMAPWKVSDNLAYGFAAVPPGGACGKCYQLDFTGTGHHEAGDAGSQTLAGKHMIVQATNIGHDVNGGQFDILIPGGGVGAFNACSTQWGKTDLGAQYGGFLTTCNGSASCVRTKCNSTFAGKPELLDGCLFLTDWMGAANNPNFKYAEVTCPAALKQVSGMN